MAVTDKSIGDLTAATQITTSDLFVLQQNNVAKKLTGDTLKTYLAQWLNGHGGIADIDYTAPVSPSVTGTITITLADGTIETIPLANGVGIVSVTDYWAVSSATTPVPSSWSPTVPTLTAENKYLWHYQQFLLNNNTAIASAKAITGVYGDKGDTWYTDIKYAGDEPTSDADIGDTPDKWVGVYYGTSDSPSWQDYTWYEWKGETGDTGNGIASIAKTSWSGLTDTYTITYDDGDTDTFTVTNGSSISSIAKTGTNVLTDTYAITLTNGQTGGTFTVTNAKSISSITSPGNPGLPGQTDTYIINFNNGDTDTFTVYNGTNGEGSVSTVSGIQPVDGNVPQVINGAGAPTQSTSGTLNQLYWDTTNKKLYYCAGESSGSFVWYGASTQMTVDSTMSTTSTNPVQNAVISTKVGTGALTTTASDCSGAINEHDAEIGNVSTLTTTATNLAGAVNELDSDISTINGTLGSTSLPTTAQTVTGAIDEIHGELSDVLYLADVACAATTGNFVNCNNSAITASHVVVECVFASPEAIAKINSWTTTSGNIKINGTCGSATTVNLVLAKKVN